VYKRVPVPTSAATLICTPSVLVLVIVLFQIVGPAVIAKIISLLTVIPAYLCTMSLSVLKIVKLMRIVLSLCNLLGAIQNLARPLVVSALLLHATPTSSLLLVLLTLLTSIPACVIHLLRPYAVQPPENLSVWLVASMTIIVASSLWRGPVLHLELRPVLALRSAATIAIVGIQLPQFV
jgi:hypothetical protein